MTVPKSERNISHTESLYRAAKLAQKVRNISYRLPKRMDLMISILLQKCDKILEACSEICYPSCEDKKLYWINKANNYLRELETYLVQLQEEHHIFQKNNKEKECVSEGLWSEIAEQLILVQEALKNQ